MKLKFDGIDNFIDKLELFGNKSTAVAKSALYEGAGVAADELKKNLEAIPTASKNLPYIHSGSGIRIYGMTKQQKADVINAMGITKMRADSDGVSVRVGFNGYTVNGKGEGSVPVALLVRSFESGTSFVRKAPIVRKAFATARPKVKQAIETQINRIISEEFNK